MKMKKLSVVLLSLLAAVMVLSGCGGGAQDNDSAESAENGAKNSDQAILIVSFGTSYNDSRDKTIGAIETAAAEAFPKGFNSDSLPVMSEPSRKTPRSIRFFRP